VSYCVVVGCSIALGVLLLIPISMIVMGKRSTHS